LQQSGQRPPESISDRPFLCFYPNVGEDLNWSRSSYVERLSECTRSSNASAAREETSSPNRESDLPLALPILLFPASVGYHRYGKRTVPSRSKPSNLRATKQDEVFRGLPADSASRKRAFQAVNTELIDLYWQVGATISCQIKRQNGEMGFVERLAADIAKTQPGLHRFTQANLFRMRQFCETYQSDEEGGTTGNRPAPIPTGWFDESPIENSFRLS
jgi:hypothetical protein